MTGIVRTAFLVLVWIFITKYMVDYLQDQSATEQLKNNMELATHDAAMMIDVDMFSEGYIVFDRTLAEMVFKSSFETNMKLTGSGLKNYNPIDENTFFKNPVKIVHYEYIDDTTYPDLVYPCTYGVTCGNADYDIYETVKGPSIVVVAETLSPRAFTTKPKVIRQAVVYEYGAF